MEQANTLSDQEIRAIVARANALRGKELIRLVKLSASSITAIFRHLMSRFDVQPRQSHSA